MITYINSTTNVNYVYDYPVVFSIDEILKADYYYTMLNQLTRRSDKVFANEVYGNQDICDMYKYNLIHYLYYYLKFINEKRLEDIENGLIYTSTHYYDLYQIECISEKFRCMGVDIQKALKIFSLSKDNTQCLHQQTLDVCTICDLENKFNN